MIYVDENYANGCVSNDEQTHHYLTKCGSFLWKIDLEVENRSCRKNLSYKLYFQVSARRSSNCTRWKLSTQVLYVMIVTGNFGSLVKRTDIRQVHAHTCVFILALYA